MARGGTKNGKDNSQNNLDPNYVPSGAPGLAPSFSSEPSDDLVSIREQVDQVPTNPGCYLWKDGSGKVICVGKAKNLRARMRQYVTLQDDRAKIPLMMQVVRSFDYIVVENEHEALVLERNLLLSIVHTSTWTLKTIRAIPTLPLPSQIPSQQLNTRARNTRRVRAILVPTPILTLLARLSRRLEK